MRTTVDTGRTARGFSHRTSRRGRSSATGSRPPTARSARSTTGPTTSAQSYLVVDTGPWIFGKKVMLPGGIITTVDHDDEKIFVDRTKEQIKNAPEFDDSLIRDDEYRGRLGSYYGTLGPGRGPRAPARGPTALLCNSMAPRSARRRTPRPTPRTSPAGARRRRSRPGLDDDLMHDRLALRAHLVAADGMDADILTAPSRRRARRSTSASVASRPARGPKLTTISVAPASSERRNAVAMSMRTRYPGALPPNPANGGFWPPIARAPHVRGPRDRTCPPRRASGSSTSGRCPAPCSRMPRPPRPASTSPARPRRTSAPRSGTCCQISSITGVVFPGVTGVRRLLLGDGRREHLALRLVRVLGRQLTDRLEAALDRARPGQEKY